MTTDDSKASMEKGKRPNLLPPEKLLSTEQQARLSSGAGAEAEAEA